MNNLHTAIWFQITNNNNNCKTFFWEKDLSTEGKATVCYSNYRVADCNFFLFVQPPGVWQKGTLASDWPKRCGLAAAIVVGGRVKGSFLEVGEGGKISVFFLNNEVRTNRRWLMAKVYFKWPS